MVKPISDEELEGILTIDHLDAILRRLDLAEAVINATVWVLNPPKRLVKALDTYFEAMGDDHQ